MSNPFAKVLKTKHPIAQERVQEIVEPMNRSFTFTELQTRYPEQRRGYLSYVMTHAVRYGILSRIAPGSYEKMNGASGGRQPS